MTESRRILHMDSDVPSVYLPIGSPVEGGSCAFATEKCQTYCPSGMVINEHERYALGYFQTHSCDEILEKLLADFGVLVERPYNAKMIQWFPWGDCLPELTTKIANVVLRIRDAGIPQYGFTRNRALWSLVPSEDRLAIGLTVDDLEEAKKLSVQFNKMTAHPDFERGYAEMIYGGRIRTRCSGWWCISDSYTRNSDCTLCLAHGEGCYPPYERAAMEASEVARHG